MKTIEEKAKAYDKAIKVAADIKAGIATYITDGTPVIDAIFPELKKFEDEEIRKWLIGYFNQYIIDGMPQVFGNGLNVKDVIDWLEKQGEKDLVTCPICGWEIKKQCEQKSAWSEEDERMYKAISIALTLKSAEGYLKSWYITPEEADNWLKSIKDRVQPQPKQEWSEEDKEMLESCCGAIAAADYYTYDDKQEMESWLKSLRPQSQWKPSESDIRILEQVIDGTANPINYHATLHAILEKLKKLREE